MAAPTLEERVTALEAEIVRMKNAQAAASEEKPWWEQIRGMFKDDPIYKEAMRLGRDYHESLRPAHKSGAIKRRV